MSQTWRDVNRELLSALMETGQSFVILFEDKQAISRVKTDASELSTQESSEFMDKYPLTFG